MHTPEADRADATAVLIGESEFRLLPGALFHCTIIGEVTPVQLPEVEAAVYGMAGDAEAAFRVLVDLNRAGRTSREARALWKKLSEDPRVRGIALFGVSPLARVFANFLIHRSGNKCIRFFPDEAQARAWLQV